MILDADCVPDPRLTCELSELHRNWPAVILHVTRRGRLNTHGAGNISIELDLILSVGGYDETFEGYGREDKDLEFRLGPLVTHLDYMLIDDDVSQHTLDDIISWAHNCRYFNRKHGIPSSNAVVDLQKPVGPQETT